LPQYQEASSNKGRQTMPNPDSQGEKLVALVAPCRLDQVAANNQIRCYDHYSQSFMLLIISFYVNGYQSETKHSSSITNM